MAIPSEVAFSPIRRSEEVCAKEFSAVELAEFFLQRLETIGKEHNAVVTVTRTLAIAQAQSADEELGAGEGSGPAARHSVWR